MCPDFPKVGGASAAEVAAAVLVNPSNKVNGANLDAAVSSRSVLTQTDILSDATPFAGGNIAALDAAVSSRSVLTQTDILSDATPFAGGNVAAVKSKTDNLPSDPASNTQVNTRAAAADYSASRAAKLDKIQDFLEEGNGTLTADGNLQTVREYTGLGKLHAYIDLSNMAAPDTVVIAQSMKIKAAGAYVKYAEETYSGVQTLSLLHLAMKPSKNGVKITLQQTAGSNKAYDWETLVETVA